MSPDDWNEQYAAGLWDYLSDSREVAHYAIQAALIHHFSAGDFVLDVACGEGILQGYLKPWGYRRYLGIDKSAAVIDRAMRRTDDRTEFVVADAETFTPPVLFTCVAFSECLYYFSDPDRVVQHYARWIMDGGIIVTSVYASRESENLVIQPSQFKVLEETTVINARGAWKCTAFSKEP